MQTPGYYRQKVEELRRKAEAATNPEAREQLLMAAADYEHLAAISAAASRYRGAKEPPKSC